MKCSRTGGERRFCATAGPSVRGDKSLGVCGKMRRIACIRLGRPQLTRKRNHNPVTVDHHSRNRFFAKALGDRFKMSLQSSCNPRAYQRVSLHSSRRFGRRVLRSTVACHP